MIVLINKKKRKNQLIGEMDCQNNKVSNRLPFHKTRKIKIIVSVVEISDEIKETSVPVKFITLAFL